MASLRAAARRYARRHLDMRKYLRDYRALIERVSGQNLPHKAR
jgi:hypothetical protein